MSISMIDGKIQAAAEGWRPACGMVRVQTQPSAQSSKVVTILISQAGFKVVQSPSLCECLHSALWASAQATANTPGWRYQNSYIPCSIPSLALQAHMRDTRVCFALFTEPHASVLVHTSVRAVVVGISRYWCRHFEVNHQYALPYVQLLMMLTCVCNAVLSSISSGCVVTLHMIDEQRANDRVRTPACPE
jgi:hypothetical protein